MAQFSAFDIAAETTRRMTRTKRTRPTTNDKITIQSTLLWPLAPFSGSHLAFEPVFIFVVVDIFRCICSQRYVALLPSRPLPPSSAVRNLVRINSVRLNTFRIFLFLLLRHE